MGFMQKVRRKLFPPTEVIEGYENPELVETIFRKTVSYQPLGEWPLVVGVRTVLDFGGGAGLHYKAARKQSPDVRWAVVETPAMARRAKELATDRLMFFDEIAEASAWLGEIELMHSDGAIQYVPDAIDTIRALCAARPRTMVWRRVPITAGIVDPEIQTSFLSDNGPGIGATGNDKLVRYARHRISEGAFVSAHDGYHMVERSADPREDGTHQFRFSRQ